MDEKTVNIPGISCLHCVATIQRELTGMDGVTSAAVDIATKDVTISFGPPATWKKITGKLMEIGFPAAVES